MKVTINVDCTPEEARSFLGLPDLTPLHASYIEKMQQLMADGLSSPDMTKMTSQWLPNLSSGLEQFQKAMWSAATSSTPKSE
jgi:uncharacterized protein YoaH (UPF0181 family)